MSKFGREMRLWQIIWLGSSQLLQTFSVEKDAANQKSFDIIKRYLNRGESGKADSESRNIPEFGQDG